ncbi:hypothetical protein BH20GEM3_BH20GEM3_15750 [soil metagenome]
MFRGAAFPISRYGAKAPLLGCALEHQPAILQIDTRQGQFAYQPCCGTRIYGSRSVRNPLLFLKQMFTRAWPAICACPAGVNGCGIPSGVEESMQSNKQGVDAIQRE